jgi:hypothetical protein
VASPPSFARHKLISNTFTLQTALSPYTDSPIV